MDSIGLDLHKRESPRVINADSGTITDRRIATSRERFTAVLAERRWAHAMIRMVPWHAEHASGSTSKSCW